MCANASRDDLNSHEYWGELKTFSLQIIFIAIQLTQNLKKTLCTFLNIKSIWKVEMGRNNPLKTFLALCLCHVLCLYGKKLLLSSDKLCKSLLL